MASGIWVSPRKFIEFGDGVGAKALSREIASRHAAWDFSGLVGLLPDPDPILAKLGDGAEILNSMTADGHLLSVMQTRKIGSLKREYRFEPGTEKDKTTPASEKLCERLTEDLARINTYDVISAMLDAPYYGMTPVELLWEPRSGGIGLVDIRPLPYRWFGFDEANAPRFKSLDEPEDGETLPWGKFIFVRHFPTYDNPYGLRLLSRCFWPVFFKKGGLKFWVTFTEKYGMPFLLGRYRQGATEGEQAAMLAALARMVQDAVAVVPDGSTVEMIGGTGKTGGSPLAYSKLIDAMDTEISKTIMGQTLTAEVGNTGSYAAAKTHENVLADYRASDQALVKKAMDEIGAIYGQVNAPNVPPPFFKWFEAEDPNQLFAERDKTLTASGQVRLTKTYYIRRYGLQENDIEIIEQGATADDTGQDFAEAPYHPPAFTAEQQALEHLATLAMDAIDWSDNEQQILQAVQSASDYDQAMENLLALYPDLDMAGLQDMTERVMVAAELHGRRVAGQTHTGRDENDENDDNA